MTESTTTLSALTPDSKNANKGTARGLDMLQASLKKFGAGRSIVLDRDGRIIAGNKTAEAAALVGMQDVIVVKTDGKTIVAVQRTDLDLNSPEARELAIADNRTSEVSLEWNSDVLGELQDTGLDLTSFFTGGELDALLGELSQASLPLSSGAADARDLGIGAPATAGSEEGLYASPTLQKVSAQGRPLGPQGAPAPLPAPQAQSGSAAPPDVEFKEFDETVAEGVTVHQCPACANRWAE